MLAALISLIPATGVGANDGISPNIDFKDVAHLERKVIEAYNREGCAAAMTVALPHQTNRLGAAARAILASCQKNGSSGSAAGIEPIGLEDRFQYYVNAVSGLGYETNPSLQVGSAPVIQGSSLALVTGQTGVQRQFGAASIAANYITRYNKYFSLSSSNNWQNSLELPITFRAGTNEDIRIRPFGGYQLIDGSPFYLYGGISVVGDAMRGNHRQAVQGSIFYDKFYSASYQQQQGTHFRFDYSSEFFPVSWYLQFLAYVEHVQAGREVGTSPARNIPFSHNDIAFQGFAEYDLRWVLLGIGAKLLIREDDNDSRYTIGTTGSSPTTKRREDFQLTLSPSFAFPLGSGVHLIASYKWFRQLSNMGAKDFVDKNIEDHVVTLAFRASFTNF